MGKVVSILIGLGLIALGVWGCAIPYWREAVVDFLKGGLVITALLVGLGILVFGLSELRAAPQVPPPPPASQSEGDES